MADDDLLHLLCHRRTRPKEARRWLSQHLGAEEIDMAMHDLEDYDEAILRILAKLPPERLRRVLPPEQWLAELTPEQRLAGLTPEQRVAGLSLDQLLLVQSDDVLRALPNTYLDTFSAETCAAIRARIGR